MAIEIPQNTSILLTVWVPFNFCHRPHYKLLRKVEKLYPARDQRNRSSFFFFYFWIGRVIVQWCIPVNEDLNRVAWPRCVHNKPLTTGDSFFCKRSKNCLRSIIIFTVCFFLNGRLVDRLYYVPPYIGNLNFYL